MLSQNLRAIAARFDAYRHTGAELAPEAVESLCAVLNAAATDASALEHQLVPARHHPKPFSLIKGDRT